VIHCALLKIMFPSIRYLWVILCLSLGLAFFATKVAYAEQMPEMRPALIGSSPNSLINLIDAPALLKKGQGDAVLLFVCRVDPDGKAWYYKVYRVSEGGEKLRDEVKVKMYRARFVPAVYKHHNTFAWLHGAVMFWATNGKPRLRIFANHQTAELEKESDFIEPQSIYIPNHFYDYVKYPAGSWSTEDRPAVVDYSLTTDASGNVQDVHVLKETPSGKGFGEVAIKKLKILTFLPAYRNGKPISSTTVTPFVFFPSGWNWKP
jgi:hypothetical protein